MVQVDRVRKVGNAGVVVQTTSKESAERLRSAAPATLRVTEPKRRAPLVSLRHVDGEGDMDQIYLALQDQNFTGSEWTLERLRSQSKLAFKKRGRGTTTVVLECSPALREALLAKEKVYIGWQVIEVVDFLSVTCCRKCHMYGHPEKYCRASEVFCGRCGASGHRREDCSAAVECCATCKRFNKADGRHDPHHRCRRLPSPPVRRGTLRLQHELWSALATRELPALAKELRLDCVLLQEHYSQAQQEGPVFLEFGASPKAAVYIVRQDLRVVALHHLSTAHCATVCVSAGRGEDLYLVSAYFQYSEDVEPHLLQLERVHESLRGKKVVIGADCNAHSPMWHSEPRHYTGRGAVAERRRQHVEDFITGRDLVLHNQEGQPSTFSGPNGESNIDITLGTRSAAVSNWIVHDGVSSSDHRLITFTVGGGRTPWTTGCAESEGGEPPRFRGTGVDWARFRSTVSERMGNLDVRKPASVLARDFTDAIVRSAYDCLGTARRRKDIGYEWWNDKLDAMRKKVARLRRAWQSKRSEGGEREESARAEFRAERRKYRKLMEETQNEYNVREAETGNTDPWGQAYRIANGRFRPPANVLSGVKYLEGYAESVDQAADSLLGALCPDDDLSKDSAYHGQVRVAATLIPSTCSAPPPGPEDLLGIVRRLPNTAPGLDGITARMVKEVWSAASVEFHSVFAKCVEEGVFPDVWKEGRLVVMPKSNGKPLTDPKAYRPITLLPILGKILERVLLKCAPQISGEISDCQHGFTPGRSTVTALQTMLKTATESDFKYVLALFLDISGAFDNAMGLHFTQETTTPLRALSQLHAEHAQEPEPCPSTSGMGVVVSVEPGPQTGQPPRRRARKSLPHDKFLEAQLENNNLLREANALRREAIGLRREALKTAQEHGTFVATITYAAACWAERATLHVVRSQLLKAQRGPLILLTKAYRTTSTSALAVLAGVLRADLEVIRAGKIDLERQSATRLELSSRKREIGSAVVDLWQQRWASDERGSHLRRFFPTVTGRLEATWVSPDYETSQILTGHGCFRWRLHGFRLCASSL
ncbi:uncharacterized protein LOC123878428 [Maniola jurtina]|uniref:uncharacterized protein LOC123878428 n=1 Tax=Maniola jurtina TaxID=191418 RepID=UPI001E68EABE|nr:uncharacterized protein LOC123878428 [Maniola jurtina]